MNAIKYIEDSLVGKIYKPDMEFRFRLAIPCVEVSEYALLVEHDGQNEANVNSMLKLADEGKAPYCVSLGVWPGSLLLPDGSRRDMRMNSYDLFDREYADFLVYELIPYVKEMYHLSIMESPDMHFVSGGSSGGISAFVIAWFHPEYFRRVYMSSPSFLAMGRGNEIPYLIRKYETKPIRIYEEYSENEPNDYFGWSRGIDEEAREALTFANYDFRCVSFANEGHCSRYHNEAEAYKRNAWIWQDWQSKQITAPNNSPRVQKVIPVGSRWEPCERFPAAEQPVSPRLADIYTKVVRSNDDRMWYAGSEQDDIVYAHVVGKEASPDQRILHATLHTIPRQGVKGPIDMTVDRTDRLYVLTEIGIQCVRSYGLIDVILDLPDGGRPQKIAVTDGLYVQTDRGIYRRALCEACITPTEEKRKQISYYD